MIPAAIVSSLLAVLLAGMLFRDRPATRRSFLILLPAVLLVVPALCLWLELRLTVALVGAGPPAFDAAGGQALLPWLLAAGGLWSGLFVLRLARARLRIHRLPRVDDARLLAQVGTYARQLGIRRRVSIAVSELGPASTTLGEPIVLLPRDAAGWQPVTLQAVLAHELVHVARRDDVWINLSRLVAACFWWLPWLSLLPRMLEQAVEESCDDRAAELAGSDAHYVGAVYELARARSGSRGGESLAAGVGLGAASSLLARMRRFGVPRQKQLDTRAVYWATLTALVALTTIWSLQITAVVPKDDTRFRLVAVTSRATDEGDLVLRIGQPAARPLAAIAGRSSAADSGAGPPH